MRPVWAVSLEESADRRSNAASHLGALGMPFEFLPAIDGRRISPADLRAAYSESRARRLLGRPLTAGEVGCSLSHLAICRRMLETGVEEAVACCRSRSDGAPSASGWPRDDMRSVGAALRDRWRQPLTVGDLATARHVVLVHGTQWGRIAGGLRQQLPPGGR